MGEHLLNQTIVSCTCYYPFVLEVVETICDTFSDVVCIFNVIYKDVITKTFETHR